MSWRKPDKHRRGLRKLKRERSAMKEK
jgi:hypothetical protein